MSGVPEAVRALLRFDVVENFANGAPERVPGPGGGVPEPMLDPGERMLDRVQVRTVRRQEEHARVDGTDRPDGERALVAGQAVHHVHVTRTQRRDHIPRHTGHERLAVDRAAKHPGGVDPVGTQAGNERGRVPLAERGRASMHLTSLACGTATAIARPGPNPLLSAVVPWWRRPRLFRCAETRLDRLDRAQRCRAGVEARSRQSHAARKFEVGENSGKCTLPGMSDQRIRRTSLRDTADSPSNVARAENSLKCRSALGRSRCAEAGCWATD